jgi:outer membrane protein assembly factor BamD (BamD/ComL family)
MKNIVLLAILAFTMCGCATTSGTFYRHRQASKLCSAVTLLQKKEVPAAMELLTAITNEQRVADVTDEALFRLALLNLGTEPDKGQIMKTLQLLKRLEEEYPASPWTVQAAPLQRLLAETKELRRNLHKLKILDMELEQKRDR